MSIYARVDAGVVQEIINPLLNDQEAEWPIAQRFTAEFVAELVDVTNISPSPQCWWTYDGKTFSPPVPAA